MNCFEYNTVHGEGVSTAASITHLKRVFRWWWRAWFRRFWWLRLRWLWWKRWLLSQCETHADNQSQINLHGRKKILGQSKTYMTWRRDPRKEKMKDRVKIVKNLFILSRWLLVSQETFQTMFWCFHFLTSKIVLLSFFDEMWNIEVYIGWTVVPRYPKKYKQCVILWEHSYICFMMC